MANGLWLRTIVTAKKDYKCDSGAAGRLAEWDGKTWTVLEETAFTEVWGRGSRICIATGWDKRSVIMKVLVGGKWQTYRLPKGSQTFDGTSYTEWMRIREVETERLLMDCHGIFYEVPYHLYSGQLFPIKPMLQSPANRPGFLLVAGHAGPGWQPRHAYEMGAQRCQFVSCAIRDPSPRKSTSISTDALPSDSFFK